MNPNVVIIGVPRSGSSITAKMLRSLGWNYAPDANWGGESKSALALHHRMIDRENRTFALERFDEKAAREFLHSLTAPWVIKDLSWSFTLPAWEPLFREFSVGRGIVVIWSTRKAVAVEASWRRRIGLKDGGTYLRPDGTVAAKRTDLSLPEWFGQAERTFHEWEGVKVRVDLADLRKAAALFDTSLFRGAKRRVLTWWGLRGRRTGSQ